MTHVCLLGDANSVHLRRWAAEMRTRGHRISVVTARPEPMEGVVQRVLAPVARQADWLFRTGQAQRFVAELAPDIVHAHYVTSYGYLAARCGRHPLVMTAWGSDLLVSPRENRLVRALTGWTLRRADLVTGDSADLMAAVAAYRPRARAELIHWGVDLARFGPVAWSTKPGFQIASLRSWEPNYRIDVVVDAFARLLQRQPDAGGRLHLLGGGSLEPVLRRQVAALGIEAAVTFHGRVGDATMAAVLGACKVSVSVPESDATSVSVLESMASGLPVIATDLPANRHWLTGADADADSAEDADADADADADLRVRPGDVDGLAASLDALCRDDARAEAIGRLHHARMQREGSRAAQMDRMSALYDELAAR